MRGGAGARALPVVPRFSLGTSGERHTVRKVVAGSFRAHQVLLGPPHNTDAGSWGEAGPGFEAPGNRVWPHLDDMMAPTLEPGLLGP